MADHSLQNSNALLLYKVGPVLVCSPSLVVEAVVMPPALSVPLGTNSSAPGMFKSMYGMVRVVDLRVRFGVDAADIKTPGRIIIAEVTGGHAGLWVDEIEDVIEFPEKGWSKLPAHVPKEVFSRALIRDDEIRLYAELENLDKFKTTGYLRSHIENIKALSVKNKSCEKDAANKIDAAKVIPIPVATAPPIKPQAEDFTKYAEKTPVVPAVKKSVQADILHDVKKKYYKEKQQMKEVLRADKFPDGKKSSYIKAPVSNNSKIFKKNSVIDKPRFEVEHRQPTVKVSTNESGTHRPEIAPTNSSYGIDTSRTKVAASDNTENGIGLLWVSASLIGFLMVAIYVIEFTDVFVATNKISEVSRIYESPAYEKNRITNSYTVKNNEVGDDNAPASGGFENGKVKISRTNEEFVIEINDFQDVEESVAVTRQVESVDKSSENIPPDESAKINDKSLQLVLGEVDHAAIMQSESSLSDKVESNELDDVVINKTLVTALVTSNQLDDDLAEVNTQSHTIEKTTEIKTTKYIHIVVKGDTLWDIAKRYVNNPWKYPELARLSKIKDPDLIYPGQKVIVIHRYKE